MTELSSKVIFIDKRKTSMRLANANGRLLTVFASAKT